MGELKPGWRRYRFEQMAINVNDRVDDPKTSGVDRYVGLEHLDPDSLKIRRWGTPEEVEAQKLRFQPGDIIFGKRRAYQRKVAVADFEGICSAHAMVLRARPNVVLSDFLPFFMQSDVFMHRAQEISVGSLSPTINWRTLAAEEFALPPLEEQRRLAVLMRSASTVIENILRMREELGKVQQSYLKEMFSPDAPRQRLEDICSETITYGIVQAGPHDPFGVPYIRVSDMTGRNELSLNGMLRTSTEIAARYKRSEVRVGDIVVALRGVAGHALQVPEELDGANLTQGTARVSVAASHNPRYVLWALRSTEGKREIRRYLRGWKGESLLEITLNDLRKVLLPVPHRTIQEQIVDQICLLEQAEASVVERINLARTQLRAVMHTLTDNSAS